MKSWVSGPTRLFWTTWISSFNEKTQPAHLDGSYASGSCSNGPWIAHDFRFHRWS